MHRLSRTLHSWWATVSGTSSGFTYGPHLSDLQVAQYFSIVMVLLGASLLQFMREYYRNNKIE